MKLHLNFDRSYVLLCRTIFCNVLYAPSANALLFKLLVFSSFLFLNYNQLQGQSIARQVIGITGGSSNTSFGTINWTAGQTAVAHVKSSDQNYSLTQGFQQPNLSIVPDFVGTDFHINVFPNPTQDLLQVTLWDYSQKNLRMSLSNVTGQILIPNLLINPWENEIDLTQFPAGTYFLKVFDKDQRTKSFKIIKTK